jgi:hypothetical protein
MCRVVYVSALTISSGLFPEAKKRVKSVFSVHRLAQRRNRVVRLKTWLTSTARKPFLYPSRCNTQYPAQTQTIQQYAALYSIMALYAGGLVRATKRKAPFVFGSKDTNGERN